MVSLYTWLTQCICSYDLQCNFTTKMPLQTTTLASQIVNFTCNPIIAICGPQTNCHGHKFTPLGCQVEVQKTHKPTTIVPFHLQQEIHCFFKCQNFRKLMYLFTNFFKNYCLLMQKFHRILELLKKISFVALLQQAFKCCINVLMQTCCSFNTSVWDINDKKPMTRRRLKPYYQKPTILLQCHLSCKLGWQNCNFSISPSVVFFHFIFSGESIVKQTN